MENKNITERVAYLNKMSCFKRLGAIFRRRNSELRLLIHEKLYLKFFYFTYLLLCVIKFPSLNPDKNIKLTFIGSLKFK